MSLADVVSYTVEDFFREACLTLQNVSTESTFYMKKRMRTTLPERLMMSGSFI